MAQAPQNAVVEEWLARLPTSPDLYPQKVDLIRGLVLVIQLDAAAYRAASFLDDRILGPSTRGAWLPGGRVTAAARQVSNAQPLHYIFHTGHVGSTLVSRLLDETGAVLSLREPLPLRTLAEAWDVLGQVDSLLGETQFTALLEMSLQLWGRAYGSTRATVIKATSTAGRMAIPLMAAREPSRAICLNLRPEPYLVTLLAGTNSAVDLRGHGPERMRRLQARCLQPLAPLHQLSMGELAALAWIAETAAQRDLQQQFPERTLAVDFDAFLADVGGQMERIVGHLGLAHDPSTLARVAASPVLNQYSKAPEQAFSAEDRRQLLREARGHFADEISKGLVWLDRLAKAEPQVAAILAAVA